jgi:hypothetical protein
MTHSTDIYYGAALAKGGEWTRETQMEIERIFGDDCPISLIYKTARQFIGGTRAELEKYYDLDLWPGGPRIVDAALVVANDLVFIGLTKVRNDYLKRKHEEFRAGRKAAAATIDTETCECWRDFVDVTDVYGFLGNDVQTDKVLFVRSPESGGPIADEDLSDAQVDAIEARIARYCESEEYKRRNAEAYARMTREIEAKEALKQAPQQTATAVIN